MINLTIDNLPVEVHEGTTVLNAAKQAGIEIPTLCDHPHMTPYGGCRLCMVEVEGFRTLQSACTIPVMNNMVVRTNTEKVNSARKFVLGLIFSERNHFCPYCQVSGGDCELQNAAYGQDMTHWPVPPKWQPHPMDGSHPYFVMEHNRCILCRRCIRACRELVGVNTLGVEERGPKTFVIADLNVPLGESSCVSCGMCVQVCPTGALIDRRSAYMGLEEHLDVHKSICIGCSLGCGIRAFSRDGQVIRIEGDWDAPINSGVICQKGRYEPLFEQRQRIKSPLVRTNGKLEPASWEEALRAAASHLSGKGDVAALASTSLTVEALHLFKNIFVDKLANPMVTTLEEGLTTAIPSKLAEEIHKPFESSLDSLTNAGSYLVIGSSQLDDHEVAEFFIRRSIQDGIPLVVVDADDGKFNDLSNCELKPDSDTEVDVLRGLIAAIARLGLNKVPYSGDSIADMNEAAKICGVTTDILLEAAYKFASPENAVIIYDASRVDNLDSLMTLLKLAEISGAALFNAKGGANSLAAAQYGLDIPFKLNGEQTVFLALGDEDPEESMLNRLKMASALIVQAAYASDLTDMADVVLPAATMFEQEGHYLSADGRMQKSNQCIPSAYPGVKSNFEVLADLAGQLNISTNGNWQEELHKRPSPVEIHA